MRIAFGAVMQKRAAIYVRVSTDKQTVENQVAALRQIAERRGWQVIEHYSDAGKAVPRAAMGVQASTRCSRMRSDASLM